MIIIEGIAKYILNPLIYLLAGLAILVFLWGCFLFVANADDDKKREEGKKQIFWGLIGLTIIFSVYGILNFIQNTLVDILIPS